MGQPITTVVSSSSRPGLVRFEINRSLTGMGHERYRADVPVEGDRPPDRLARAMFDHGGVIAVHIYANVVTAEVSHGIDMDSLREVVESLYIFYRPGVEVVVPEGAATD